jgi:D-cysteine desulfhydrase
MIPRVALGRFPTPIAAVHPLSPSLWIKRDDLCADPIGGNKVRALEFLLGGVKSSDRVVTVGSVGSTHALAVAIYGKRLGAQVVVGRWAQEMNPVATQVAERLARTANRAPAFRNPVFAYAWAYRQRLLGAHWIAAGGSTPLGILGHVNAGLELVDQITAGLMPEPVRVVVPLGTGGTAAGLALAFALAGRKITVVGARVVPWIVARRSRVLRLARDTARLIERETHTALPRVQPALVEVIDEAYGGAYGRETDVARAAAAQLRTATGIELDGTYSAKAFAAALQIAGSGPTLFWLTFDSRLLTGP